ncbi:MAG: methyltransferase domain-containing protein [Pirellulaceae bacterium]|nr:methyltransferase domain-containing protein [Pirellulaceae bacterium]MDP7015092.1 methyltransferase domain-containing protein [Pirellulaceae bacterium]
MSDVVEQNSTEERSLDVDGSVRDRYSAASQAAEPTLCCPVDYSPQYLAVIPQELIDRDYGCGDPSRFVQPGDCVLDLGSGGGKVCYIASQIVGQTGRVIGVDINDEMLELARSFQEEITERIGWRNVEFRKGRIQDLALDIDQFETYLLDRPVRTAADWRSAEQYADRLRRESPLVADDSVDVVISNCVLNLVRPQDRRQLFGELHRVLKRSGRAAISDIVSDEPVPIHLQNDPQLWSGCISGAFVEHEFLRAFEEAGFYGVEIVERQAEPWAVIEGIEFRSMTVQAYKGKDGPCDDYREAVMYKGPWKSVTDDDGHVLRRGVRSAVCRKTFELYGKAPYADQFVLIPPQQEVSPASAQPFDCHRGTIRDPRDSKSTEQNELTMLPEGDCCGPDCC